MREKIVNLLTIAVAFLTILQGLVPTLPIGNEAEITLVSAVVMFLASTLTVWKQKLSEQINTKAIWPTIIIAIIASLGGVNDLLKVFHLSDIAGQWIRFAITFITMSLNLVSKVIWPTDKTSSII